MTLHQSHVSIIADWQRACSHLFAAQELLQYTMQQHLDTAEPMQNEGTDDFADWASLESALPDGTALPSSQNGSPAKLHSNSRTRSPV